MELNEENCSKIMSCFFNQLDFEMPEEYILKKLVSYSIKLRNSPHNLLSKGDRDNIWNRHIIDSLSAVNIFKEESAFRNKSLNCLDNGTGGGLPGVPLSLLTGSKMSYLDSTGRKIEFLRTILKELEISAEAFLNVRAEEEAHGCLRESFDIVVSRAMTKIKAVIEISLPFVSVGGVLILWRSSELKTDIRDSKKILEKLGGSLEKISNYVIPGEDRTRNLMVIRKMNSTDKKFPRDWKQIIQF